MKSPRALMTNTSHKPEGKTDESLLNVVQYLVRLAKRHQTAAGALPNTSINLVLTSGAVFTHRKLLHKTFCLYIGVPRRHIFSCNTVASRTRENCSNNQSTRRTFLAHLKSHRQHNPDSNYTLTVQCFVVS